jgi:SNF2 family DNA or RNA helicase
MLVSAQHRKLILNLKDYDRVLTLIPTAKGFQYKGRTLVAVPHAIDEVRVLRNMGLDAPSPMSYYYEWAGRRTPFVHQKLTSEFLVQNPRAFVLNGLGSGKTLSALWAFDYLKKIGLVRKMLVISPLSTLERAWGDEIYMNFPHLNFNILHGTRERRHKLLKADADIYIINHDGFKHNETIAHLCERDDLDVVLVDEIASFRNSQTDRWKYLNALVNGNPKKNRPPKVWVWGMTGTPTPNSPTDAHAQIRLIKPGNVTRAFTAFREQVLRQVGPYKWIPRDDAVQTVTRLMQPAIRFATRDCIDLPPTTYVTRETTLTDEQQKAFNEMMRSFKTEAANGTITAANAAVKLSKLLQICCGVAYGTEGEVHIPATPRLNLVKELIEESEGKVLVFVPLTAPLLWVAEELRKVYGEGAVAVVHGATTKHQRDIIFSEFQKNPFPNIIVANPGTLSHGLTLTEASTTIWYAPVHSNETYQQANGRTVRPGQRRTTVIVNVEATSTERLVYTGLQNRENMQSVLLQCIKEFDK